MPMPAKNSSLTGCFRKGRARETEGFEYKNGQPATKHDELVHQGTSLENTVQMLTIFGAAQNFCVKGKKTAADDGTAVTPTRALLLVKHFSGLGGVIPAERSDS